MGYKSVFLVMTIIQAHALGGMHFDQASITRFQQLPPDIKKDSLLRYLNVYYPNMDIVTQRIRSLEILICQDTLLEFLNTLYYKAHAIDLADRLKDLRCMQHEKIAVWIKTHKQEVVKQQQLLAAAELGDEGLVKFLLADRSIDLNAQDGQTGFTPAMLAVQGGHGKIVMQLLAAGADFNKKAFDGACARTFKW